MRIRGLLRGTEVTCIEDESTKLLAIGLLYSNRLYRELLLHDLILIDRRQSLRQRRRVVD
jgi:hypothetical protein